MKKIISIALSLFCASTLFAQNAAEQTIDIAKVAQPCVMATYNINEDLLIETIEKRMAEAKMSKPDKSKGFKIYKGVSFPAFSNDKLDIYIKTDGKKETSICYMALSRGYDNFLNSKSDSASIAAVKNWMNNLVDESAKVQLMHDIETAQETNGKAEKKYNSSVDDGKDYQKDLEKLQRKIEENKADQAKLLKAWEEEKAKLEALRAKQK